MNKKQFERKLFWSIQTNNKKKKGIMTMKEWNKIVQVLYDKYKSIYEN